MREKAVRDAKAGLILDAAMKVFGQSGYHATRLEDVAASAGFSKASLYNYYDSKEALFLNLAIREYDRLLQDLNDKIDETRPLADNVEAMVRTILGLAGEHFGLLLEVTDVRSMLDDELASLARHHQQLMDTLRERLQGMQGLLIGMVSAGRARGEFTCRVDDARAAQFIGAQIRGVLFNWKVAGAKGDIDNEVAGVVEFILHGMGAP